MITKQRTYGGGPCEGRPCNDMSLIAISENRPNSSKVCLRAEYKERPPPSYFFLCNTPVMLLVHQCH